MKRIKHETLQLFLHPLHQYCFACVKESMTTPNVPIPFCMLILPEQSKRISHTQKQSSSAFDLEASSMPNALGSSCCWAGVCTWLVPDSLSGGFRAFSAAAFAAANVINDCSLTFCVNPEPKIIQLHLLFILSLKTDFLLSIFLLLDLHTISKFYYLY